MTDIEILKRQFLHALKRGTGEAYLIVKDKMIGITANKLYKLLFYSNKSLCTIWLMLQRIKFIKFIYGSLPTSIITFHIDSPKVSFINNSRLVYRGF